MSQAKQGDSVKIHYTGRLRDGSVFDTSSGRDPLEFTIGSGMVIPGFDRGVTGMNVGEKRTIEIPAADAYGPHHPELVLNVPKGDFPPDVTPEVGQELYLMQPNGQPVVVTVIGLADEHITLDANHALAGKDLIFDLELVAIG